MTTTNIEWTDRVWNCIRGCERVSSGCQHCYAEGVAARFSGPSLAYEGLARFTKRPDGRKEARWTGKVLTLPEKLNEPLRWRKPQRIFVNSMSDLFHEDVPDEFIAAVFGVMAACPQHTFQCLTKRPERMRAWFERASGSPADVLSAALTRHYDDDFACAVANYVNGWSRWRNMTDDGNPLDGSMRRWPLPNVHLGVSVEDQQRANERIPLLLETPAAVRFLSMEPLLGPVDLAYAAFNGADSLGSLEGLHWVIVGGESGPGARPCHVDWIRSIVKQCRAAGVPVFVKQLGAVAHGRPHERSEEFGAPGDEGAPLDGFDRDGKWRLHLVDKKGGDPAEWPTDLRVREFPEVAHHPSTTASVDGGQG